MMNPAANHDLLSNPNFTDQAILHLDTSEYMIALHLFTAAHGNSQRFYMDRTRFASWLSEKPAESFLDADMAMFLKVYRIDEQVMFRVSFVTIRGDDTLTGYQLTFRVPIAVMKEVLAGTSACLLVQINHPYKQAGLRFSTSAQAQVAAYAKDKLLRRALSKALRSAFYYGSHSHVTLYADIDGFYFVEENGISGGLVHHSSTVRGRNGKVYTRHSFSVHT